MDLHCVLYRLMQSFQTIPRLGEIVMSQQQRRLVNLAVLALPLRIHVSNNGSSLAISNRPNTHAFIEQRIVFFWCLTEVASGRVTLQLPCTLVNMFLGWGLDGGAPHLPYCCRAHVQTQCDHPVMRTRQVIVSILESRPGNGFLCF